ncbi:MAG: inorganic phosphate transporter [Candidatus Omnitrophota bacterium]|nr:inorganic phosphate transporter [Candidatus Omnitrophota bacterium]
MFVCILLVTIFLAYSNGANDNFKGVATLFGSGATDYKKALWWATITTLLGSIAALFVATKLVIVFSGKGLVPDAVAGDPHFLIAVGLGAACTVFIASLTGMPISTTHSLIGALVGAGIVAVGTNINLHTLSGKFFAPLLFSPVIAALLILVIYPFFKRLRIGLGIERQMCLCVGGSAEAVCVQNNGTAVLKSTGIALTFDQLKNCQQVYSGKIIGFDSQEALDKFHFVSAGAVSFARGLNDTPKIVALLLAAKAFSLSWSLFLVAVGIAIGGLLNAKKVALTMSERITAMNHGQGFSANLITALLVIFASRWGMPVSTTHVSCGSLFGVGLVNKKANLSVIKQIILAWILTLPIAAIFAGVYYSILRQIVI